MAARRVGEDIPGVFRKRRIKKYRMICVEIKYCEAVRLPDIRSVNAKSIFERVNETLFGLITRINKKLFAKYT